MKNVSRTWGTNKQDANSSPHSVHRKTKWRHSSAKSQASVEANPAHGKKASATGQAKQNQTRSVPTIFRLSRNKNRNDPANESQANLSHASQPVLPSPQLHNPADVSCPENCADLRLQSKADVANARVEDDVDKGPAFQSGNRVTAAVGSTMPGDAPFAAVRIDEIDDNGENTTDSKGLLSCEDMEAGHDASRHPPSHNSLQTLESIIAELALISEDLRLHCISADRIVNRSTDMKERKSEVIQRNPLRPERAEVSKTMKWGHIQQKASKRQCPASSKTSSLGFDLSHERLDLSAPRGAAQLGGDQWCFKASVGGTSNTSHDSSSDDRDYDADDDLVDFDVDNYFASLPSYSLGDEENEAFQLLQSPRSLPPVPSLVSAPPCTDSWCSEQQPVGKSREMILGAVHMLRKGKNCTRHSENCQPCSQDCAATQLAHAPTFQPTSFLLGSQRLLFQNSRQKPHKTDTSRSFFRNQLMPQTMDHHHSSASDIGRDPTKRSLATTSLTGNSDQGNTKETPPSQQISWVENNTLHIGQEDKGSLQDCDRKSPLNTREMNVQHSSWTGFLEGRQVKRLADKHDHMGPRHEEHSSAATCTQRSSVIKSRSLARHQAQVSDISKKNPKAIKVNCKQQNYMSGVHQSLQYDPDVEKSKTFNHHQENAFSNITQWLTPHTKGLRNLQVHYAHTNTEHNQRVIFAHLLRTAHVRNTAVEEGVYMWERRLYARRHDTTSHATTFYDSADFTKKWQVKSPHKK